MSLTRLNTSWLEKVKKLHAIAESGLAFDAHPFDLERYQAISAICVDMFAELARVPIETMSELVTPNIKKYITPQIEVRAAVFWQQKILLVKEHSDGKWALPGGYADVGLSPKENIQKELVEETGLSAINTRLFGLRHKAAGPYKADIRDFYKLHFLCEVDSIDGLRGSYETPDVGFYPLDDLPELSTGRTIIRDIEDALAFSQQQQTTVIVD